MKILISIEYKPKKCVILRIVISVSQCTKNEILDSCIDLIGACRHFYGNFSVWIQTLAQDNDVMRESLMHKLHKNTKT